MAAAAGNRCAMGAEVAGPTAVVTGDYKTEIKKAYAQNNPEFEVNNHSQYLLFWAMTGIFGLLIFYLILFDGEVILTIICIP